jgi:REP element-mobilizing transposase RayT
MSRPPRIAGFDYTGLHCYMITFCTHLRAPRFADREAADDVLLQFRATAASHGFEILACCVMPDHVHLLVRATSEAADLRRFVRMAKQRSGYLARRSGGARLWQEGHHERVLRDGEDLLGMARYILENPLRAGLVEKIGEYEHAGSDTWTVEEILAAACWDANARRA